MTIARVSQLPAEAAFAPATVPVRADQVAAETVVSVTAPVRINQFIAETIETVAAPVRADQFVIEAIYLDPPPVTLSQVVAEAAFAPVAPVRIDQTVVEVLMRDPAAALPDNIVFAVAPNWESGLIERLEFRTWDVRSHGGLGQRAALRWVPRLSVEYALLAKGAEAVLVDLMIAAGQSARYIVPRWQHGQALGATLPAGSSIINIDTADREFVAGGYALIRVSSSSYELVQVLAVFAGYITLAAPTAAEWPASAQVYPAARAILADSQPAGRVTASVLTATLAFQFIDLPAPESWTPAEALGGVPVWTRVPDGSEDREVTYTRQQNRIDYGFVQPHITDAPERAFIRRGDRHVMFSRSDVTRFRGFFAGGQGRRRKFYRPVHELGLVLAADALATDSTLTIDAVGYADYFVGLSGRLALGINSSSGVWTFAAIQSIAAGAPGTDTVTLTAPLGVAMPRSDVARIFFLELVTHDADVLELHWITDRVAESRIATIGVSQ